MNTTNTTATRQLQVIDTALLPRQLSSCSANDTELGPCEHWCGRTICALRADCTRPVVAVQRTLWQRVVRWQRIRAKRTHLKQLERYARHLIKPTATELARLSTKIAVARVDLALAERP
jgi:hypothetical protein